MPAESVIVLMYPLQMIMLRITNFGNRASQIFSSMYAFDSACLVRIDDSLTHCVLQVLENSASMYEKIRVGSTLMVETSDFRNRLVIEVTSNTDNEDQERPFNIRFYNIGLNRNDFAPLELEHGTSGYVWVEPGQYVTHNTAVRVPFTLRDSNHVPVITTELFTYEPEL